MKLRRGDKTVTSDGPGGCLGGNEGAANPERSPPGDNRMWTFVVGDGEDERNWTDPPVWRGGSITFHLGANPLPLFTPGMYFHSDPRSTAAAGASGGWRVPSASQQRHYPLVLSLVLSPSLWHQRPLIIARSPSSSRGRGRWTSSVSVNQPAAKILADYSFSNLRLASIQKRFFILVIIVSQLPDGIYIITSMISCGCQGLKEEGVCAARRGDSCVSVAGACPKVFSSLMSVDAVVGVSGHRRV